MKPIFGNIDQDREYYRNLYITWALLGILNLIVTLECTARVSVNDRLEKEITKAKVGMVSSAAFNKTVKQLRDEISLQQQNPVKRHWWSR